MIYESHNIIDLNNFLLIIWELRKGGLSYLGEVKSAGLSAGSTPGGHADGAAGPEKGAVDLPGAEARSQAPDVLRVETMWSHLQDCQNVLFLELRTFGGYEMICQRNGDNIRPGMRGRQSWSLKQNNVCFCQKWRCFYLVRGKPCLIICCSLPQQLTWAESEAGSKYCCQRKIATRPDNQYIFILSIDTGETLRHNFSH